MLYAQFTAGLRWPCVVFALAVSACSTADYAAPIKTFSDATDAATTSLKEMNTALADTTLDYLVHAAAQQKASLQIENGDCGGFVTTKDVRCRARFDVTSTLVGPVSVRRDDYTDPLRELIAVMVAVQDYAANLAAVQSDNTVEEVDHSVDSIQASLTQLMAAANKEEEGVPKELPKAAGDLVKWGFGQYIESVKFRALRDATSAARRPLELAQEAFREMLKSAKVELSKPAGAIANNSLDNMDPKSESDIRAALAAQNTYDDLLTAPLSSMFDNLVEAHDKLADALDGTAPLSVREALAKLKQVKKQAEEVAAIADNLRKALKPPVS